MALSRADQAHDIQAKLWYMKPDLPKMPVVETKFGTFRDVIQMPVRLDMKEHYEKFPMTIVDGRKHLPGGKEAWKFDEHGFCYIKTPEYDFEEHHKQDRRRVNREFGPKVVEACVKACGAKSGFWMSHQRRAESGTPTERPARGAGHSDYGPENENQVRAVLAARYGVPQEEAQTCGLAMVNLWCPVNNPAYRNPLCLLDGSTVDEKTEWIRRIAHPDSDNGYGYYNGKDTKKSLSGAEYSTGEDLSRGPRPLAERVPQAAHDAPSLAPAYGPQHRWVYLPDMTTDEAVVFKQIDFRKSAKARATFHCAIDDRFHNAWKECPGRCSIECRVILTFDPEEPSAKL